MSGAKARPPRAVSALAGAFASLRERWSVCLTDTAEGWMLRLSTVGEQNEIVEHEYSGADLAEVVWRAARSTYP